MEPVKKGQVLCCETCGVELFDCEATLRKLLPKLVRSWALDALMLADRPSEVAPAEASDPAPADVTEEPAEAEPSEATEAVGPAELPAVAPAAVPTRPFTISSKPLGATVTIDGRAVGTTPLTRHPLADGPHTIRLVLGEERIERQVTAGRFKPAHYHWTVESGDWSAKQ